jgi:hypothetical protein
MEETGTTIHTGLVRRNNFLRENPIRWRFVAADLESTLKPSSPQGQRNDRARTGA